MEELIQAKILSQRPYQIECPQQILLKFVINDLLYMAEATLEEISAKTAEVVF